MYYFVASTFPQLNPKMFLSSFLCDTAYCGVKSTQPSIRVEDERGYGTSAFVFL